MKTVFKNILAAVAISAGIIVSVTGPSAAADRSFWLANEGRGDVYSVRISPSDGAGFSVDLLGSDVVAMGDDPLLIRPRGFRRTCVFDIEITKGNGHEIMLWDVDLCAISGIVVDGRRAEAF